MAGHPQLSTSIYEQGRPAPARFDVNICQRLDRYKLRRVGMNPVCIPGMVGLVSKVDALIKEEACSMQVVIRCSAVLAFAFIAGCAGGKSAPRDLAVVTVSAYGPDLFGQHSHGTGGQWDVKESSKAPTTLSYPPMDLRTCNQAKTACVWGIGVVEGTAQIVSSSARGATVSLNLTLQVGRSYSSNAVGHLKMGIPPEVPALQGYEVFSKTIDVAYGEVVHLPLPYGVDVAVCAQKHYVEEITPDRSVCQGN